MSVISGKAVWQALISDPSVEDLPAIHVLKPYVEAMPEVLKTILDNKVTLATITQARILYIKYLSSEKLATKQVMQIPPAFLGKRDPAKLAEEAEKAVIQIYLLLEQLEPELPKFLAARGMSEADYFSDSTGLQMRSDLYQSYLAGSLTIGDLLLQQPFLIINNK